MATTLPELRRTLNADILALTGKPLDEPAEPSIDCETAPKWFHDHQREAWASDSPIIAICAGWQSGKTVFLPPWLKREIQRKGPGDYGAFSSTYKLLQRKFLPELEREFKGLAEFQAVKMRFVFTEEGSRAMWGDAWDGTPTVIQTGYAENPDSLESATMKAIVWDEPGQRLVPEQSFQTIQSRLMVNRGRMALASRPYEFGWFQRLVLDGSTGARPTVCVISFPSWANPVNPPENDSYWDDIRAKMPDWKFTILYRGRFTRPLGMIYDCFDRAKHTVKRFPISHKWIRIKGTDFGNVHTASVFAAIDPKTNKIYVYRTYLAGNRTTNEHVAAWNDDRQYFDVDDSLVFDRQKLRIITDCGGAPSEDEWRAAFAASGWPISRPFEVNVEVGIARVYELIKSGRLVIFDDLDKLITEIETYSREVNDNGEPTIKIQDKATFHRVDALRYLSFLCEIATEVKPLKRSI